MPTDFESIGSHFEKPGTYRIRVRGEIGPQWSDWLGGMHISPPCLESKVPTTELIGSLSDQAALVGVLNALYDMHLSIVSVECLPDESLKDE
jgi:hypothetical protein